MKRVGVTGPTGAGKTTVLRALEELGCSTIDCDGVYHRLLASSPALLEELTGRFGRSILDDRGGLDRKALGAVVFADPAALSDLSDITHRHIKAEVDRLIAQAEAAHRPGVVIDAIALIESGLADTCDVTLAVTAPEEVRVRRIMARDGISEPYARSRVSAQKPSEYYVNHCTYSLVNDGSQTPAELSARVAELFRPILGQSNEGGN